MKWRIRWSLSVQRIEYRKQALNFFEQEYVHTEKVRPGLKNCHQNCAYFHQLDPVEFFYHANAPIYGCDDQPLSHALLLHDVIYLSRGRIPSHNYYILQLDDDGHSLNVL
jgi:hypothetical protein